MDQNPEQKDRAVDRIIRSEIRSMSAYQVADAEGFIKLDAMENPYSLPLELSNALGKRITEVSLNRYPSSRPDPLINKLRYIMRVPDTCEVILGNGSDEIISNIALATAHSESKILTPVPGFSMYEMAARFSNQRFIGVPLRSDLSLDINAMITAIQDESPTLIYLAYPNNPTGNLFQETEIEAILETASESLVIIDEAYYSFSQSTWINRIPQYDNMAVLRTLSKIGLAGIRLGFLIAAKKWIRELDKVRLPYNINSLTQTAAEFLMDHMDIFNMQASKIRVERSKLAEKIGQLQGTVVFPSHGNFLLVRVPDAEQIFSTLLNAKILIKNMSKVHPLLQNCLRITVGNPYENERLVSVLRTALS